MGAMASQITSLTIVYSIVYSGADQRKHQSFGSLVFVRGIHRWSMNSPQKGPVTRKMFPFDDVIMGLSEWRKGFLVDTASAGNMNENNELSKNTDSLWGVIGNTDHLTPTHRDSSNSTYTVLYTRNFNNLRPGQDGRHFGRRHFPMQIC